MITDSGIMTILFYKGLTRNPDIGNTPVWVLPNTCRLGQVMDTKFDTNVSNRMLLNAAKFIQGKPTAAGGEGGGGKITTTPSPTQIRVKCLTVRSFKVFNSCNFFQNDIENINPILLKCISTILNRCKVIKKYINYTFSSNQNQLKDKSDVHFFKYHILAAFWQYQK